MSKSGHCPFFVEGYVVAKYEFQLNGSVVSGIFGLTTNGGVVQRRVGFFVVVGGGFGVVVGRVAENRKKKHQQHYNIFQNSSDIL